MTTLEQKISHSVEKLYSIREMSIQLSRPDPQFGDYATNIALQLAKRVGENPREIGEEISAELRLHDELEAVSVAGPGFINITVSAQYLAKSLETAWSDEYGQNKQGEGKTVIVEYPSPNMAKPYSVGHLRPANQGWAAKRLMEESGWNVVTINHLGDYGAPFGIWVVGFRQFSSDELLEKDGIYELGRVYIETKKVLKEEEERGESVLSDEVQQWLLKLEKGDKEAKAYSERFNRISLAHIHDIMSRLGISTDHELGEAMFAAPGKEAVQTLLRDGIATQNEDGSIIVLLNEFGFDVPLLIQKSNGTALYATTDLGALLYREKTWQPDRVIYVVGAEQQFHFAQLFALAKKLGVTTELIHLWFGVIDQLNEDGTREKMSSRKGVVLMEELLNTAEQKAREVVTGREVSDEDVTKIALGAIKFSDFIADRRTNILFSWESIFALSGFSGPYIQYAAVRVNKLLTDSGEVARNDQDYNYESEKKVITKLLDYPSVVASAAEHLEPHKIATYLYELAREMNRYYEITRVVDAPDHEKAARIAMLQKVSYVFAHGLSILGISVPEKM